MRAAVLALVLLIPSTALALDFVRIGQPGKMSDPFIGCKDKDDTEKVRALYSANDRVAALKYAAGRSSGCMLLPAGTLGVVEHLSGWSADSCIRPKGEPECFWVPVNFVVAP